MKKRMFLWGSMVSMLFMPHVFATCTNNPENAITKIEHTSSEAEYCTEVNEAFTKAQTGEKIILLTDVNVADLASSTSVTASNASEISLIFDLNGKKITAASENSTFYVEGGIKLEIVDSSADQKGTIENTKGFSAILVKKGTLTLTKGNYETTNYGDKNIGTIQVGLTSGGFKSEVADLIVKDGVNIKGSSGITIFGDNKNVTIVGGKITAKNFAISGNGSSTINSTIKINGGNLTSTENAAIYQPQSGTLSITSGNITGKIGIVARQGTITVDGGTISASGTANEKITTGDALKDGQKIELNAGTGILVDNTVASYSTDAKVTITNGSFETTYKAVDSLKTEIEDPKTEIEIKGGTFNQEIDPKFLATGLKQTGTGKVAETAKIHNIKVEETIKNGTISVISTAAEGEKVALTIIPKEGYQLDKLTVRKQDGDKDILEVIEGIFTMPGSDVEISATFKVIEATKDENKPSEENPNTGASLPAIALIGMLAGGVSLLVISKKNHKFN